MVFIVNVALALQIIAAQEVSPLCSFGAGQVVYCGFWRISTEYDAAESASEPKH